MLLWPGVANVPDIRDSFYTVSAPVEALLPYVGLKNLRL